MRLSHIEGNKFAPISGGTAKFALIPGEAEELKKLANANGNYAWFMIAKNIIVARQNTYIAAALTAIGILGALYASSAAFFTTCIVGTLVGIGLTISSGIDLWKKTKFAQDNFHFFVAQYAIKSSPENQGSTTLRA